jgi:hypothetical protein
MTKPNPDENPAFLWQIPSSGLVHRQGSWYVAADRTLGDAWGLLAPVRQGADGRWEIAAGDATLFTLARVLVDDLRELGFPEADEAGSRYLCLLRYDYPPDRPSSTFNVGLRPTGRRDGPLDAVPSTAPSGKAAGRELRAGFEALRRQYGRALERQFVSAPAQPQPQVQPQQQSSAARAFAPPAAQQKNLTFIFASCQYPAGMLDRAQASKSYEALADHFEGQPLPTRLLLVGDQVYTDATYGALDPTRLDDRYRLPYEQLNAPDGPLAYLPHDFRAVMRMTPDDHEIVDNWEPWSPGARGKRHQRGLDAYWRFQRGENTAPHGPVWIREPQDGEPREGWRLFMADTRTTREYRNETTIANATILGQEQTRDLEDWLGTAPRAELKIVTSAAMLLPRTRSHMDAPLRLDGWPGYPASFRRLLAFVCDREVANLVFLSGDAHLGCRARVRVRNRKTGKHVVFESHHAPALYAPYPFANESRWNLLSRDRFSFDHAGATYDCKVAALVHAEGVNGFGLLQARGDGVDWKLQASFPAA